jgi:pimeloyl-ACP methyl ester carboxylesterase
MPYFTHDDHRLFYRRQGEGPLLLLLPGNTASSAHMQGELDHFGARFHAVALDFWGTGRSERMAPWPLDWWAQGARDAAALVEALGYADCVAMGTSGGGIVALLMALLAPERVAAVVADSCGEHYPPEALLHIVAQRAQAGPQMEAFWQYGHGEDWAQVVEADSDLLRRLARQGGDVFEGRLGQIEAPVLLTASLRDEELADVGAQVCAMTARIPRARAFLTGAGGHPVMWTQPEDFRRAADCFLAALDRE